MERRALVWWYYSSTCCSTFKLCCSITELSEIVGEDGMIRSFAVVLFYSSCFRHVATRNKLSCSNDADMICQSSDAGPDRPKLIKRSSLRMISFAMGSGYSELNWWIHMSSCWTAPATEGQHDLCRCGSMKTQIARPSCCQTRKLLSSSKVPARLEQFRATVAEGVSMKLRWKFDNYS